ncbi:MAG: LCP family protein [Clostridia bacterium]|nr:LCP family protein [Clostridia bacterium]
MPKESIRRRERRKSGSRWFIALLVVLAIAAGIVGVGCYLLLRYTRFPVTGSSFNILLIGEDKNYTRSGAAVSTAGRMDAIMLMVVPRDGTGATLVSIPRDTLVRFPSGGVHRINASIVTGGIELARSCVSDLVGLPVHRYMAIDFQSFIEVVDAMGGVEIAVDKRMNYEDKAGGYDLDLKPGVYHMDGETALKYVRFRHDALGDISRAGRQQQFLKAILKELATWDGVRSYRTILKVLQEYTRTDLTTEEMTAVGWRFRSLDSTAVDSATLPGRFKGAYWEPDREGIEAMVNSIMSKSAK